MVIHPLSADRAVVFLTGDELDADSRSLSLKAPLLRRLLRDAARAAFGAYLPRLCAEWLPLADGSAFILRADRSGECILSLRFPDAAAASGLIAAVSERYSPEFCLLDGELRLILRLPCRDAQRLAARTEEFCIAEFITPARAAYIRQWSS